MASDLPFGYSYGQKRSHAEIDNSGRASSPVWSINHLPPTREPLLRPHFSGPPLRFSAHISHERRSPTLESRPRFDTPRVALPEVVEVETVRDTPCLDQQSPETLLHLPRMEATGPPILRRSEGDGLDFRRPVRTVPDNEQPPTRLDTSRSVVIDLTEDDSGYGASQEDQLRSERNPSLTSTRRTNARLPWGMDIIIDLDNGEEQWQLGTPPLPEPTSPEIQFISSRTIQPEHRAVPARENHTDGDDVEFVRERPLSPEEIRQRRHREDDVLDILSRRMPDAFVHQRSRIDRTNVGRSRRRPYVSPASAPVQSAFGERDRPRLSMLGMPVFLDFETVGFNPGGTFVQATEPPPPPTYNAPPKAPRGFTRSPTETDVLVCPNCGDELCAGDDELKQQVWLAKGCGHVYCGECTSNRSARRSSKGKERSAKTKPFKDCVVEGCGKKVSNPKAMIQIFL